MAMKELDLMKTKIPQKYWEACQACGDVGYYVEQGINEFMDGEGYIHQEFYPVQVQCEFCHTNYKSIFNQRKLLKG